MRVISMVGVILLGLIVNAFTGVGSAQSQSSASAFATSGELVRATIGTFIVDVTSALAFEIVREEPCPCLCDPLSVTSLHVLSSEGRPVFICEELEGEPGLPVPHKEWTGRWDLVDQRGHPVPVGAYRVIIKTTIGEFYACIEVVAAGMASQSGRVSSKASVCGVSLTVYRWIDETANGEEITLHEGERLLVGLPGNPTTGYAWEVKSEPTGDIFQRLDGPAYRPSSTLIGAGGTFFFRYEAVSPGEGELALIYRRAWETGPAMDTFTITVVVH